jgi:hypothetical protein
VSLRWAAALWNPYTSALVPEDLKLEISGLPGAIEFINADAGQTDARVSVAQAYGEPLIVTLPWTPSTTSTVADQQSWLPGRVYNWTYLPNAELQAGVPIPGRFNSRDLGGFANGLTLSVLGSTAVNGTTNLALSLPSKTRLTVKLLRASDDALLATYTSPEYDGVPITAAHPASNSTSQLGFLFRLAEPFDSPAAPDSWLTSPARDPRATVLPEDAMRAVPNGTNPAAYENFITVSSPDRLLDRATNEHTYDSDTPVFELPRAPILSLGALQHLQLPGRRPFSIGNSWGFDAQLNTVPVAELFDRYFFSGLAANVAPTVLNGALLLPNPTLRVLRNATTNAAASADDLRQAPNAQSSKFLLQGAAFNLNSVSVPAWIAVLRSVRFPAPQTFSYLNASFGSGTSGDGKTSASFPDAHFFRFSQSAQETYEADPGYAASSVAPPEEPDVPSAANTHLYRQGMRTLTAGQVSALAGKIVEAITAHLTTAGPYRSLEEFLAPLDGAGSASLLEQAIADAGINVDAAGNPIEFSSQYLTQADILTALAPVLFPRSDTFVIRAYGEALNPVTSTTAAPVVEGRAWCEAIVQRVPEYFDPAADDATVAPGDLTSDLNKTLGRRFKVVSFRWLTRSDI